MGHGAGEDAFTSVEGLRFVWRHRVSDVFTSLGRGMDPGSAGAGDGAGGNLNTRRVGRWHYRAVREDVLNGIGRRRQSERRCVERWRYRAVRENVLIDGATDEVNSSCISPLGFPDTRPQAD